MKKMILDKRLVELLFSTVYMERWNDTVRPVSFTELDKQGHKMVAAWYLASLHEEAGEKVEWHSIVDYLVAEALYRAVVTDLHPGLYEKIRARRREELDGFVSDYLKEILHKKAYKKFRKYLQSDENATERRILAAASHLATAWEFELIRRFNPDENAVRSIADAIGRHADSYGDLPGMRRLAEDPDARRFLSICASLRFQKRWTRVPRTPQTSVLGHMGFVAMAGYFLTLSYGGCRTKRVDNFFTGLFRDLPEALTKDIITPLKYGVPGLRELVAELEEEMLEEEVYPLLPEGEIREKMRFYLTDEFSDRIRKPDGTVVRIDDDRAMRRLCDEASNAVDGRLMKAADNLGAYVEALYATRNGIRNAELEKAMRHIRKTYRRKLYGLSLKKLFKSL